MKWREVFLGRPLYWLLWLAIVVVLYGFGAISFHVRHFVPFSLLLLLLCAVCVAIILLTYRPGERITREPFDEL